MAYKEKSDAIKYNNAYNSKTYDRINVTVPKGQREIIRKHADAAGQSVNAYILQAIQTRMLSDDPEERTD